MALAIAVWEIYIKISFFKLYSKLMFWPSCLQTFSCTLFKLPHEYWCKLAPKEIHSGDVPIIGELVNPWTPVYLTLSVVWLTSGHSTRANSKASDPWSVVAFKDLSGIFSKIVQNTTFEYFLKNQFGPISLIQKLLESQFLCQKFRLIVSELLPKKLWL